VTRATIYKDIDIEIDIDIHIHIHIDTHIEIPWPEMTGEGCA